jgi:hypothetical protein
MQYRMTEDEKAGDERVPAGLWLACPGIMRFGEAIATTERAGPDFRVRLRRCPQTDPVRDDARARFRPVNSSRR